MQAIARVNRVFRDKPGGLVVDYLGLAHELKQALAVYTESGGKGKAAIDQDEAVALMLAKHEVCCEIFEGFDWAAWTKGRPEERCHCCLPRRSMCSRRRTARHSSCLRSRNCRPRSRSPSRTKRRSASATMLGSSRRCGRRSPSPRRGRQRSPEEIEHAIRQLVSRAVASEEVVDIFAAAGLKKPDISILSEEFLAEVRGMPHRNLAVELLRKLLAGEIKMRSRKNLVQARSFSEMLENALKKYQNRAIEAAQVIEELIALAKDMREADKRGEELGPHAG
jgi:type I restriction enzyme R subunit